MRFFFCLFFKASKVKTPQILSEPSGHLVKRHLKLSNPLTPSLHAAGLIENIYCSQRGALSHTHSLLRTQRKKTQAAKSGETQRKVRKKKSDYMESGFWWVEVSWLQGSIWWIKLIMTLWDALLIFHLYLLNMFKLFPRSNPTFSSVF